MVLTLCRASARCMRSHAHGKVPLMTTLQQAYHGRRITECATLRRSTAWVLQPREQRRAHVLCLPNVQPRLCSNACGMQICCMHACGMLVAGAACKPKAASFGSLPLVHSRTAALAPAPHTPDRQWESPSMKTCWRPDWWGSPTSLWGSPASLRAR